MNCPICKAEEKDIIGVEVRGVYDGVLYWICRLCKYAWNRWPNDKNYARRHQAAQGYVDAVNQK